MKNSNAIKNLCIALEALSRMPGNESETIRVRDLLSDLLTEDETASRNQQRSVTDPNTDDEIQF